MSSATMDDSPAARLMASHAPGSEEVSDVADSRPSADAEAATDAKVVEPEGSAESEANDSDAALADNPDSASGPDPAAAAARKRPAIDTNSKEMFPELGKTTQRSNPAPAGIWGKGTGNTNGNGSHPPSAMEEASPPAPAGSGPPSKQAPAFQLPGQESQSVVLEAHEIISREDMKRPLNDLVRDFNKRSRVRITQSRVGAKYRFEATGPKGTTEAGLRDFVSQIAGKLNVKELIPSSARALLIGRAGETIKSIEQASGARIHIPKAEPHAVSRDDDDEDADDQTIEIVVTGNTVTIAAACGMIRAKVGELPNKIDASVKEIPAEFYLFLAGPNNSMVERLKKEHGVEISIPHYNHVFPADTIPEEDEDGKTIFYPAHDNSAIKISGPRPGVRAARLAIRGQVDRLRQCLTFRETSSYERGQHEFILDGDMPMSKFYAKSGCVLVMPQDDADDIIRIVGMDDSAFALAANICEEQAASMSSTQVSLNSFERSPMHCWNVARYLREAGAIAQLEKEHDTRFITPKTELAAVSWMLYAKDHKNCSKARAEATKVVSAFPTSRMKAITVDEFYYVYIRKNLVPEVLDKFNVRMVVPTATEKKADFLLVYEGPSTKDAPFEIPHAKPTSVQVTEFKKGLKQASDFISAFLQKQEKKIDLSVTCPARIHGKLRSFIKQEQDALPASQVPSRVKVFGQTVTFSGPESYVTILVEKVKAFIQEEEQDEKDKKHTMQFEYPKQYVAQLVGQNGKTIAGLREKFRVDITPKDGVVIIRGSPVKAERAKTEILALLKKFADEVTHVLNVAPKFHSALIGSEGATIKRLQERYEVNITIPKPERNAAGSDRDSDAGTTTKRSKQHSNEVIVRGPKRGADAAKDEILNYVLHLMEQSNTTTVMVQRKQLPSLIGAGGAVLEEIREMSQARIDIDKSEGNDNDEVEIRLQGTKEGISLAKKMIVERKTVFEDTIVCNIDVAQKHHSALIGAGGSNLRDIVVRAGGPSGPREHARMVRIPKGGDEGSTTIKVEGRKAVVNKIIASIEEFVADRDSRVSDTIDVPATHRRLLIGRGGERRRELETQLNISLDIPRQGSEETGVTISGKEEDVAKAKKQLEAILKEQEGVAVQVPRRLHHTVAGGRRLFTTFSSRFNVRVDHDGHSVPKQTTQTESSAPLITEQEGDEADESVAHRWSVTKMSDEEGDIPWVLRGSEDNVAEAKKVLLQEIKNAEKMDTRASMALNDRTMHRHIIGRNGGTIGAIRRATGCDVQVPKPNDERGSIVIQGTSAGVDRAREMIIEAITQAKAGRTQD